MGDEELKGMIEKAYITGDLWDMYKVSHKVADIGGMNEEQRKLLLEVAERIYKERAERAFAKDLEEL